MSIIEKIGDLKRFDHIINVLFKYEFGHILEKLRLKDRLTLSQRLDKAKFKEKKTTPVMVRKAFADLSGAFVKLAQFLSIRPDLIPAEYAKEFEKLQDKINPFPFEDVRKIIENEFKDQLKNVFKHFDQVPIASASIAQVHKATLWTGEVVAVKIQRPNIKQIMERDIDLMLFFSNYMEKHDYRLKGINPLLVVNEFKRWTERELDFEQEASNIEVFRANFENDNNIIIPKVYPKYSNKKMITMEFIEGFELHDIQKAREKRYDIDKLITIGFNSILKQVFVDGFFHADPHPGNIIIVDNSHIAFVDFGIVGIFNEKMKEDVTNLFCGVVKNDVDMVIDSLISLGMDGGDIQILKIELENRIKSLQGAKLKDVIISKVLEDILSLTQKHGFRLPMDFVLFGKTIMTLEGLALKYDPEFRITVQSRHFVEKIIKKRKSPSEMIKRWLSTASKLKDFAANIPEKSSLLLKRIKQTDMSLKYIDRDMRTLIIEMDRSSNRITFGLIITALIIASTIMLNYDEVKILNIPAFSFIGFLISVLLILIVLASIMREKRL